MALRDFLLGRKAIVEAQLAAVQAELSEIHIALQAIGHAEHPRPTRIRNGSIKDWCVTELARQEAGLETGELIGAIAIGGGPEIHTSSITPQLSRLKKAGVITQVGRRWMLAHGGIQ